MRHRVCTKKKTEDTAVRTGERFDTEYASLFEKFQMPMVMATVQPLDLFFCCNVNLVLTGFRSHLPFWTSLHAAFQNHLQLLMPTSCAMSLTPACFTSITVELRVGFLNGSSPNVQTLL